jgi:predicted PurR-regulated permease PerM
MPGLGQSSGQTLKVLLSVACTIIIIGGLKVAANLLIPVTLALFLALLSLPVARWLTRRKVPRPLAVLFTVALDILVLVGVVNLVINLTYEFKDRVFVYAQELQVRAIEGDDKLNKYLEQFSALGDEEDTEEKAPGGDAETETSDQPPEQNGEQVGNGGDHENVGKVVDADPSTGAEGEDEGSGVLPAEEVRPSLELPEGTKIAAGDFTLSGKAPPGGEAIKVDGADDPETVLVSSPPREGKRVRFLTELIEPSAEALLGTMQSLVRSAASLLSATFFVVLVMIFILVEVSSRGDAIDEIREAHGPDLSPFKSAAEDMQKYLAIKTLVSAATGFLAWFLASSVGLDAAPLWGVVAFALNYIPAVGSVIAAIPPVLIALVQPGLGPWHSVGILIGYLVINITLGNFVEPMLLGRRFGISTLVIILSVLFWRWVWGPMGMFLAVPLTMILMVMLENSKEFRWMAVAMGKRSARMPARPRLRRTLRKRSEASESSAGQTAGPGGSGGEAGQASSS